MANNVRESLVGLPVLSSSDSELSENEDLVNNLAKPSNKRGKS